jgi:hypothetical protein
VCPLTPPLIHCYLRAAAPLSPGIGACTSGSLNASVAHWEESCRECVVDLLNPEAGVVLAHVSKDRLIDHVESELLQITTPESLFQSRTALPPDIIRRYLVDQEHFDVSRLVLEAGSAAAPDVGIVEGDDDRQKPSEVLLGALMHVPLTKTVVFTRSSDDLVALKGTDASGTEEHSHPS